MTVGDLYVRQGETFQALKYFERLAQIYLSDGFLTKAIAIYKKITRLAPEEPGRVERLADLYVQQGVMSEARPIYLRLAEMHQRAQRPAQAIGLLRKLLDAEPDNVRVQSRLAELSLAMDQPAGPHGRSGREHWPAPESATMRWACWSPCQIWMRAARLPSSWWISISMR